MPLVDNKIVPERCHFGRRMWEKDVSPQQMVHIGTYNSCHLQLMNRRQQNVLRFMGETIFIGFITVVKARNVKNAFVYPIRCII